MMKEFSFDYRFSTGLRQHGELGRGTPGLTVCRNMLPRYGILEAYTSLYRVPGVTIDWPYPQLFCFPSANFLCGKDYICTLNSSLAVTGTYPTAASIVPWSVANFWDYSVLTNGAGVYKTTDLGAIIEEGSDPDLPVLLPQMATLCNFKGQLIAGGVTGYDENMVVYGSIGVANLVYGTSTRTRTLVSYAITGGGISPIDDPTVPDDTISTDIEVGFLPMRWEGAIVAIKRLKDKIMVYGENGIGMLSTASTSPPAFKYDDSLPESIQDLGVVAVGGDRVEHCFLDTSRSLWRIGEKGIKEYGYVEFMSQLSGTIMISYDGRSNCRDFYISDGSKCYVLTEYGLGEVMQYPTSIVNYGGYAVGICDTLTDLTWAVRTDLIDISLRSKKSIEWIEVAGANLVSLFCEADGVTGPSCVLSPTGRTRAKMRGSDFNVNLAGTSLANTYLEHMVLKWKLDDKSSIRGAYADKTNAGSNR